MQLKLLLKQSFRDFASKILLYLTFTFFLILAISVSLGMIAFSHGFRNNFEQTLGFNRVNAAFNITSFLPASINENDPAKIKNYVMKEEKNDQGVGYLDEFLTTLMSDLNSKDQQRLLLGVGYLKGGTSWGIYKQHVIKDEILSDYFETEGDIETFNNNLVKLRGILLTNYQTDNLGSAFLLEAIKNHPDWTLGGLDGNWFENLEMNVEGQSEKRNLYWEFLRTDSSMEKIDSDTPWTLKVTKTATQKIWKQVDFKQKNYQEYWNNQHIVYVQPSFLPKYHHQIGDVIQLRFITWDGSADNPMIPATPDDFLIAGTITSPENLTVGARPAFSLPYGYVTSTYKRWTEANHQETNPSLPPVYGERLYFNVGLKNGNLEGGQEVANTFFNQFFSNLKEPQNPLDMSTLWSKFNHAYSFEFTQVLFLIIAYIIGFVTLGLLVIVFYFITQQIVVLQRKTLFFLRAMGVKDSGLSLLTTFSMLIPIVVGTIVSIFGSLLIQQVMYRIAYENLAFYEPYFSFNWTYFVTLIAIIILSVLIFYFVNMILIKSKALTLEGMNGLKTNAKIFEKVKLKFSKTPAKLRIGLSFAFKNMYKNLISYFILSITFGIILFGTQFNSSLEISARAYEKWNQPYQSVNYADGLNLFAPTREGDTWQTDEYLREYDKISSYDDLKPIKKFDYGNPAAIDDPFDLQHVILEYWKKTKDNPDPESTFTNWKDYYLDREFVREKLDLFVDNPEAYQDFIIKLTKFIEDTWFPDPVDKDVVSGIVDLINQVVNKYKTVRNQYNYREGFTILMGHVFAPAKNRAVLSLASSYVKNNLGIRMIAFERNDSDSQDHYGFKDIKNDEDFLIQGSYKEYDQKNQKWVIKNGSILKVNISSYLQSIQNLRHGDVIELDVNGLKSANNVRSSRVIAYVDKILSADTINSTVYTSQVGLIQYIINHLNEDEANIGPLVIDQAREKQKKVYEDLLAGIVSGDDRLSLSNTVFDKTNWMPLGVRYITMPIFHHPDSEKEVGSKIEDFYDENEFENYLNSFGSNVMNFSETTKRILAKSEPFNETLQKFVYILLAVSFTVSSILITLVLLENRDVILLFKAMGYKKSEVNWYLISGYFISAILAALTAAGLALLALKLASGAMAEFLSTSLNFVWSWQFILFAFGLAAAFCLAISFSIVIYTNIQKPRNAFATL